MKCQRWRESRATYRPVGEPIVASRYDVALIEREDARAFVETHHYSKSYPAARCNVGLFEGSRLVGVAIFSVPMNQAVVPRYCGCEPNEGVELGRFVLLDTVPANGETWFLSRAFRQLRSHKPEIKAVVSYSDPVERKMLSGQVVKPGHIGTIYQAANAAYLGRSGARTVRLAGDGTVVSERALSKLRNGERGRDYVREMLKRHATPQAGESDEAYVIRLLKSETFRKYRHPGNFTYAWALSRDVRIESELAYPKQVA